LDDNHDNNNNKKNSNKIISIDDSDFDNELASSLSGNSPLKSLALTVKSTNENERNEKKKSSEHNQQKKPLAFQIFQDDTVQLPIPSKPILTLKEISTEQVNKKKSEKINKKKIIIKKNDTKKKKR